jgi:hypothetical protein
LFSIVIPTRNRTSLLRYALESALNQRFNDLEVVVSDNGSDGLTRELMDEFDHSRLRYVQTGSDLSMPDSWDFAAVQARGRFVTFLSDDDVLIPSALTEIERALRLSHGCSLAVWSGASYVDRSWYEVPERNTLVIYRFKGRMETKASHEGLRSLYTLSNSLFPRMLNSIVDRGMLNEIRARAGRVFLPPAPDYSFAAAALGGSTGYVALDSPLMIWGVSAVSIGASAGYGNLRPAEEYAAEFGTEEIMPDIPFRAMTPENAIAQSIVAVAKAGLVPDDIHLDMTSYFLANLARLQSWERAGFDGRACMTAFEEALAQQPEAIQEAVRRGPAPRAAQRLRATARRFVERSRSLRLLEHKLRGRPLTRYQGDEHGFSTILEAAWLVERIVCGEDLGKA